MTDQNTELTKSLMKTLVSEQKSSRRWRNIRSFAWLLLAVIWLILIFSPSRKTSASPSLAGKPYVALVRLKGIIMPGRDFSANRVIPVLNRAFSDKKAKGVVIEINSPGGSPVQASMIHDKILQLKKKYDKKVIILGEDALASGAYLVATAGDKIYVHNDTLTGSIGVIMNGFGFTGLMQKIGVTRRVFTAGNNKDRLDPFLPLKPEDQQKVKTVLDAVHQNFINDVKTGRQGKLNGDPEKLFSGDFWTGQQAVQLGLADGTGNLWTILPKEFGTQNYKLYKVRRSFFATVFKGIESKLTLGLTERSPSLMSVL